MRELRFNDPEYIVRLSKQLIGSSMIADLKSQKPEGKTLFIALHHMIKQSVRKMNSATLGKICEYAVSSDFSQPLDSSVGFIRLTGLNDVRPVRPNFDAKLSGRILLEEIAIATIVSVTFDILNQEMYEIQRQEAINQEEEYDRAMHDCIHGR